MNNKVRLDINAGGIFSKTMLGIQQIERKGLNISDCYFNVVDERALNEKKFNPFDYVMNQTLDPEAVEFDCGFLPSYNSKRRSNYGRVEESAEYLKLKEIASKIKYQEEILSTVKDCAKEFTEDIVGVHLRLCDMNMLHPEYGIVTFEDYVRSIIEETTPSTKIFVASDNEESLEKLYKLFGSRILYVNGTIRAATETTNSYNLQINHFKSDDFWKEAFLDMLLLSKCSKLICRTSNLANMAIISSNTIQKIIML